MTIKAISIFNIDTLNNKVIALNKSDYGTDFNEYLKGLISIITEGSGRSFNFERETTEIRSLISEIIKKTDFNSIAEIASNRLLNCEITTQKVIEKLGKEIQKGILVHAILEDGINNQYVICKADHSEFIKDEDYKLAKGLPIKKKVFKAFIASYTNENIIQKVLVYDTNQVMAKYWWKDFLELSEIYSDADNTIKAFDAIDKGVFTKIKKDYPRDYLYLRNGTVRYFRANETFRMQDFIENGIGDYHPENPALNIAKIKSDIAELPLKKHFDERFSIIRPMLTARILTKIALTPDIDLHLKQDINNLRHIIFPEKGPDGTKYVKIRVSDEGFNNLMPGKNSNDE